MKLIRQFAIIIGICYLGAAIQKLLGLPIPGNIIGMILLLTGLLTGVIKMDMIEEISDFLLGHLAFFFIPAGVGLISCIGILKLHGFGIFMVCLITTAVIMGATGLIVQTLIRRGCDERID